MDQILVNGLRVDTRHGITPQEKMVGQELEIDVVLDCDLQTPCRTDHPDDALSKKELVKTISDLLKEDGYNLIEHVAQRVADGLLEKYPPVERVEILLKQAQAPIFADFEYVAVRIVRER